MGLCQGFQPFYHEIFQYYKLDGEETVSEIFTYNMMRLPEEA